MAGEVLSGNGVDLIRLWDGWYTGMVNTRNQHSAMWLDIRNYLAPRTARFDGEQANQGGRQDLMILNTSPRLAVRTLPAGLQSGVTSPMRPWFRLSVPDPDLSQSQPVKEWLFEVERRMRLIFARSNIYDRLKSNYMTLGVYGTSALFIEDDPADVIRGYDFPIGSFVISTDDTGRTNALMRDVTMTSLQMISKFGLTNVPQKVKDCYDKGDYTTTFAVRHIVEPNRIYKPGSALSKHKAFASIWTMPSEGQQKSAVLSMSGYGTQPMHCPRWDVLGEDVWGTGCGEYALGDSKSLQLMEKRSLQMMDQIARPTMVADASMRNSRVTNLPGETTYVNGLMTGSRPGYAPAYQMSYAPIDIIDKKAERVEQRIDDAFFKNLFQVVMDLGNQPNITATQIQELKEEKLMLLGPVLERLNSELLDPLIDRVFDIMGARGVLPPPPKEIQGQALRVEYISVLAQAQKALGIANMERFVGFVGGLAGGVYPEAKNKINVYELIDEYGEGLAISPKIVTPNDQAMQATQQQTQQAQAAASAEQAAPAAAAIKSLGDTPMSGDTALTRAAGAAGL